MGNRILSIAEIDGDKRFEKETLEILEKKCFCNRDITVTELTDIISQLRKKENIHKEQQYQNKDPLYITGAGIQVIKLGKEYYTLDKKTKITDIKGVQRYRLEKSDFDDLGTKIFDLELTEQIQETDCNLKTFTKELNGAFTKYEINNCIRKIHFLAQSYHESQKFSKSYESSPSSSVKGGEHYRGRGLLQLTHNYNYEKFYTNLNNKKPTTTELFDFAPRVAKELHLAIYASAYYWRYIGSKNGNISQYADNDDVLTVSKEINGYVVVPNGYPERVKYTNELKKIMKYESCTNKK